jgi:phytoene synthase
MNRLEQAHELCADITRRNGPNFSVGFELLPGDKKSAVHACYAFCRLVDDLVDQSQPGSVTESLAEWKRELDRVYCGEPRHDVGLALADAARRFPIPRDAFTRLIRGCEEDLHFRAPADLKALRGYCDLVATPIGDMSLAIFGTVIPRAQQMGRDLSHALQLTNILRDVREDAKRGRVYLPANWLAGTGVEPSSLDQETPAPGFTRLMQRAIALARTHYRAARELPDLVETDSRSAVLLMSSVYEEILERIADDPTAVLRERVGLSPEEKIGLVRRLAPDDLASEAGGSP